MNWVNQSEVFITKILNKQALIQWYEMGPLSKLIMIQHIPLNSINNHDSYSISIGQKKFIIYRTDVSSNNLQIKSYPILSSTFTIL